MGAGGEGPLVHPQGYPENSLADQIPGAERPGSPARRAGMENGPARRADVENGPACAAHVRAGVKNGPARRADVENDPARAPRMCARA